MERRTFIKYSMVTGATIILPQTASALDWADAKKYAIKAGDFILDEGTKMAKAAIYCSKLNPARFVGGIIYDELKPVIVDPIVEYIEDFLKGKFIDANQLQYVAMSEARSKNIEHDPYKASIVILDRDKTDYRVKRNREIEVELKQNYELNKFAKIHQYIKDHKIKVETYDRISSEVGNDFTPNDMMNITSISFGRHMDTHLENILRETNNSTFSRLIV